MLLNLHIRDFAIVDNLEIDFSPGMSALTGETGAGKSILLDALGLLLGDRADAASVRHGQERAEISAGFDVSHCPPASDWLRDHDMDNREDCQLRRVISREGRSRAYINGSSVPVASLRELGEHLVDIHGQHEHQSLLRRDLQRSLLDNHGKHGKLLDNLQAVHGDAGQLIETCNSHLHRLYEDDSSAHSLLGKAVDDLTALADVEPALKDAGELFNSALIQMQEGIDQLRICAEQLELDPARLQWVEQRLDALHSTARKHRIEVEQLPAYHERLRNNITNLEQADQKLDALEKEQSDLEQRYRKTARQLHNKRVKTAANISRQVGEAMQALGMQGGQFEIRVTDIGNDSLSLHGTDQVDFLVSANPGQPLQDLRKVASGGELSRISLAIQVVATQDTAIPTLIFDEVDSGVGGAVAETVGQQLQTLGIHHQVLCVTHLPQVAAQAHNHLQVQKQTDGNTTRTGIERLTQTQRVDEIARMLGGQKITDSTLQHAQEMLLMAPQSDETTLSTH
jgi:DNA repair protein RecN (Recombination protein N)